MNYINIDKIHDSSRKESFAVPDSVNQISDGSCGNKYTQYPDWSVPFFFRQADEGFANKEDNYWGYHCKQYLFSLQKAPGHSYILNVSQTQNAVN